jgi:hypothetical protein
LISGANNKNTITAAGDATAVNTNLDNWYATWDLGGDADYPAGEYQFGVQSYSSANPNTTRSKIAWQTGAAITK